MSDTPKNPGLDPAEFETLFRREYSKIVAALTRILGSSQIDLAENLAQDALLKAVQTWPLHGMPEKPGAWLCTVAKNLALDHLRRSRFVEYDSEALDQFAPEASASPENEAHFEEEIRDDQLKMLFICCHPSLPREQSLGLALKTLCGLSVTEIARAFLAKEESIAQRLVRAKNRVRDLNLPFEIPPPEELPLRVDMVLESLYFMFNEGYFTHSQDDLLREDLVRESLRLVDILCHNPQTTGPRPWALCALLNFHASRLQARRDGDGDLLLLEDQDRSRWDSEAIARGFIALENAAQGEELSRYHLQAGIAACHSAASRFEETNWTSILFYYDELCSIDPNPVTRLNRAIALGFKNGFDQAIGELEDPQLASSLAEYYLFHASLGELHRRNGNPEQAKRNFLLALDLSPPATQAKFLRERVASLDAKTKN